MLDEDQQPSYRQGEWESYAETMIRYAEGQEPDPDRFENISASHWNFAQEIDARGVAAYLRTQGYEAEVYGGGDSWTVALPGAGSGAV